MKIRPLYDRVVVKRIIALSVVRCRPRRIAAAVTTPSLARNAFRICLRSTSSSVAPLGVSATLCFNSSVGARRIGPLDKITARSIKFSSSLMFPGPMPLHQRLHSAGWNFVDLPAHFGGILFREVPGQHRNVLSTVAQGRRCDRKNFQPVVKIAAKQLISHHLVEILVGRGEKANVDRNCFGSAEPLKRLFL